MSKTRNLIRSMLLAGILSASTLSAGVVTEIGLGDFVDPAILDFESVAAGDIDGDDALFASIGISSIGATATDYQDDFQQRNNSSGGALWFTAGNQLTVADPSVSTGYVYGRTDATYTIDFFGPIMRFGFSTHDELPDDPWGSPQQFLIVEFYSGTSFVGSTTSGGTLAAGASDAWDRRDFFFANTDAFDRLVVRTVGTAGFALDNLTIQRSDIGLPGVPGVPEPGSMALLGLGLVGLAAIRRKRGKQA